MRLLRRFLPIAMGQALCIVLINPFVLFAQETSPSGHDAFLEKVEEQTFRYFEKEVNPYNGLVRDSAPNQEGTSSAPASVGTVGFALSVYPVAVERGWMNRAKALALTVRTLEFFLRQAPGHNGFFYHFLNFETGERVNQSELSSIDTALLLAGALFAAEYFDDVKVRELTRELYERVDFPWMMNRGKTFAMGWTPESGFLRSRWDVLSEGLLLYVLAIGSPAHPVPSESWREMMRPAGSYRDYRLIQMPPLFTHQYPQIWLDLREKNDGLADYFQNSVNATHANRAFCIDQASRFAGYGPDVWGLSASDGPSGYRAYGAPPGWSVLDDGTVSPAACGGSIVFTPAESIACMEHIYETYGNKVWGRYGFSDAMNLGKNWFSPLALGIDEGALLLMIENYRTGLLWKTLGRSEPVQKALEKIGFRKGTMALPWPDPPEYRAPFIAQGIRVDALLRDWPSGGGAIVMTPAANSESGDFGDGKSVAATVRFAWNSKYLYFVAKVTDEDVVVKRIGKSIWRDDLLEIFVDPEGDGLFWNDPRDFQLGFRPRKEDMGTAVWSWFQGGEDPTSNGRILAESYTDEKGYIVEGAIRWDFLGITPRAGEAVRLTPAIHAINRKNMDGKMVWFFRNEEKLFRFVLGKVILEAPQDGPKG